MSRENQRSNIKKVTAAAAALLLAASLSLPSGTEIMGVSFGNAVVASAATYGDYNYEVNSDNTVTITGYTGNSGDVVIPNEIDGKAVTAIGNDAFYYCESLTSITIPDSVTSIEDFAFSNCTSLTSVTLPSNSSFTSIGSYAFYKCTSLTSITIPNSVTSIGDSAFFWCTSLESVTLPSNSSFTSIEMSVFQKCESLTSITIPDSVTSIGDRAFCQCTSLTSITIPDSVTSLGVCAFEYCSSLESVTLPSNSSFTSIENNVFSECESLTSITIPNSVTSIEYGAFCNCKKLASITIPNSVTSIGDAVFSGCESLTSISLPSDSKLTSIGFSAFKECKKLESIAIPDSVESIGKYTFSECTSLKSITIPKNVTSIGEDAFTMCSNLESISVDEDNNNYSSEDGVLFDKNKTKLIKYPENKSKASYVIPDGVTTIEYNSFSNNTKLTDITIPGSVTSIGEYAFHKCTSLASVTIPSNSSLDFIGYGNFYGCTSLETIAIPDGVTSIGGVAFANCASLETIAIPDGVTSIGGSAFENCTSLETIAIPDGVTSIGGSAFANCASLETITIPHSVTEFSGYNHFYGCTGLKSIFLPEGLDVSYANIPETTAQVRYTVDDEGNVTIKEAALNGQTSVDFPDNIGGKPVASVCIKEETTGVNTPASVTQLKYTVDDEGNVTIKDLTLGEGQTTFDIPEAIGGAPVTEIADDVLENCPDVIHTHREKTAATCTNKSVCAICGQEYGEIDPDNHSFTNYISNNDATCTKNGTETATCDNGCNKTDTREIANSALGHDNLGAWQKNDTEHWKVCTRNDCEEILDKANHDYDDGEITTPATEDAEGVKTFTCKTCGYEKTEPIAKLNHTHKTSEEYSKDETGHWHDCSGCDEKIDFESHDFDEGVVTTEPTDKTEGVKTFTCKDCGYEKTETIPVTKPSIPETPAEKVNSFVERLYENVLGRHSDPSKETHIDNLNNGETATKVAYDFVFSPEFTELDISNAERVTIMYNTFLNRDPDPAGLETWTKALDNGCSIGHIFYGFTQSGEFGDICKEYGIEQGTWEYTENRDKSAELTAFVSRLYTHVLNRKFDVNGLNDHTGNYLENHDLYQMAYNFIFSPEFIEMNLSDEDFVDTMYRTFFDREADPDGRADWLGRLKSGASREDVLAGFVGSQECADLVARFGI